MNKFKRLMFRFVSIATLFILFISVSNFKSFAQEINPPHKIKVAVYENPPKIYTDTDGVVKGFWPDLINYMAKQENWEVEYVHGTFSEGLEKLNNNQVDVMGDIGYSVDRAKIYDFTTQTAFVNWAGIYSSNNLEINSFSDLSSKRIAVLTGDIHAEGPLGIKALMKSFGYSATYIPETSYADTLKAVQDGNADIAIVNRIFGTYEEGNFDVKRTGIVFDPIELKFAFPKLGTNTGYLLKTMDKDLFDLKADSESIYYKSIIINLEGVVRTVEVTPTWIKPLIIVIIILAFLGALLYLLSRKYQITLERRVKEKTKELLKSEKELGEKVEELETAMRLMIENEKQITSLKGNQKKEKN
ncbi:MAG: transporter substrate-binding domain-containing protein [Candidatus Dojkabacteria bacterium]